MSDNGATVLQNRSSTVDQASSPRIRTPQILRTVEVRPAPKPHSLLSGANMRSGYLPRSEFLDAVFNRSISLALLVVTLPVFALIALLILATSPGPVLHSGKRLGRNREVFDMYKFRTLDEHAAHATADKTLPRRTQFETPIGSYLRISRLDELPQILNILKGDMVIFGPRPIRPELEWRYKVDVPGYEKRFAVKPGLVGLAQALMTHETAKTVRGRLNAVCVKRHANYFWQTAFLMHVGISVVRRTIGAVALAISDFFSPISDQKWLRSGFSRPPKSRVEVEKDGVLNSAVLCGMSDEVLQFVSTVPFPNGNYQVRLVRRLKGHRIRSLKVSITVTSIMPVGLGKSGVVHFATYRAKGTYAGYLIERYFLRSAVIPA